MRLQTLHVNGVELHYAVHGSGHPLVLVHGGLGDYRSWNHQFGPFSQRYRTLSYSRRYNHPNRNALIGSDHSVFTEAEDLAALIGALKLGRVHLVGHSYGAYAALVAAMKNPAMIGALVLAEPPVHRWVREVAGAEALFEQLMTTVWDPMVRAFDREENAEAVRIFSEGIGGTGSFDRLPPVERAARLQNARALKALAWSRDAFPALAREEVRRLSVPTLIVEGEQTVTIHRRVNDELIRCVPAAERAIIPHAAHGAPRDNPLAFNEAVLKFLSRCV
jgi:non-heme chloroperoxidase